MSKRSAPNGFAPIIILAGLAILLAILFVPLPYYENSERCALTEPSTKCTSKGWHLGAPIYKNFFAEKPQSSTIDTTQITPSQPSPTSDEIANPDQIGVNWKTYRSTKLGIGFQYPPEYYIDEGIGEDAVALRVPWRPKGQILDVWIQFYRSIPFPKEGDLRLCGEKEELVYDFRPTGCYKNIIIGGANGVEYAVGGYYIVTVEKPMLQIKIDESIISRFSGKGNVDKILSSLKFL